MEVGHEPAKILDEVLSAVDWDDVNTRLVNYAYCRLCRSSIEDAKQVAGDAIRTLLDPKSKVTWNWAEQPDPLRCLGSIVNGLVRNHFRRIRTNTEITADHIPDLLGQVSRDDNPEDRAATNELLTKVLSKVYDMSEGDEPCQELAILASEGILEVDEQAKALNFKKDRVYEVRRRFHERIQIVRCELEGGQAL